MSENQSQIETVGPASNELSTLVISLLKGVLYQEPAAPLWASLLKLQARVRDYVAVLGLDLILDEAEGYAYLRARADTVDADADGAASKLPRLVVRRPLSFPVSLLLALLRKKLAEFDAGGATRLVLSRNELLEMVRIFLPTGSNEARLIDQLDTHLNKIVELGFLRKLKSGGTQQAAASFEVLRILKAFVDAQWLSEFDARLAAYQTQLGEKDLGDAS